MAIDWEQPELSEFAAIMLVYGRAGIDWFSKKLDPGRQRKVRTRLSSLLELDVVQLERKFASLRGGGSPDFNFIPMLAPEGTDYQFAFFRPHFKAQGDSYTCEFMLLYWLDHEHPGTPEPRAGKLLAYRFEAPDTGVDADGKGTHSHAYHHVQITRDVKLPYLKTDLPEWVPISYPGLPMNARTPMEYFATLLVSVYGYNQNSKTKYFLKEVRTVYTTDRPKAVIALSDISSRLFSV